MTCPQSNTSFRSRNLSPFKINLLHMKDPACSCQGRGKDLAHRDVHVCHAVFKVCLLLRIFSGCRWIKRSVSLSPFPFYLHPLAGIQRVYDLLLHILVKRIIQIVDLHNFLKIAS